MRQLILLCAVLGAVLVGVLAWRYAPSRQQRRKTAAPVIEKQPVAFANHTFDPASPPADMPPLAPGEEAECVSDYTSHASVGGRSEQTDTTHAIVTVTQVKVTLQLNVAIWTPSDATEHVIEHEEGHRQIAEYYYGDADKLAARIAAPYIGSHVLISGADLEAEFSKALQQMGAEMTDEYNKELNPDATQLRYDDITDHSRNEVASKDAVAQAIQEAASASTTQPDTNPGN